MVMRSNNFKDVVEPVLNNIFDGLYKQYPPEWKAVFNEETGLPRAVHEEPVLYGFGPAPEKPGGTPIIYDDGGEAFKARYVYTEYGLAFALTQALMEDGEHISIGSRYAKHLANSMVHTKELVAANILNRAFNASYTGGDGVSLLNASHTLVGGGTYSNILATAANLSETALEQLTINVGKAVDQRGKNIRIASQSVVVPQDLKYVAQRIVVGQNDNRPGTANRDVNAQKAMNMFPQGVKIMTRLTSATAFFVTTDVSDGLKYLNRRDVTREMLGDFETGNMRYKSTMRFAFGWTDPLGLFGTAGV